MAAAERGGPRQPRERIPLVRALVCFLGALLVAAAAVAQAPGLAGPDELVLKAFTFKHQTAAAAVPLIRPLLSKRGGYKTSEKTLVIRDSVASLERIGAELRAFDRTSWPLPLKLELFLVRASRVPVSPPYQHSDLPKELSEKIREYAPYDVFDIQARARLASHEGEAVAYEIGDGYEVSLRLGAVMADEGIRASDFRVVRRAGAKGGATPSNIFRATLNLVLDQTTVLVFAKSEASPEALIVLVTVRP